MTTMRPTSHARRTTRLLAGGLVLGLATSLLGAGPAAAVDTVTNPDLAASCGLDVVIALDASTSIPNTQEVRDAANNLIGAFTDTSTRLGIVTFNASATSKLPLTLVTADSVTTAGAHGAAVAAYRRAAGGTNWQDALIKSNQMFAAAPTRAGVQRLLILVSDGEPRNYNLSDGAPSDLLPPSDPQAVDPAVTEANVFKSGGGHLLALGVGVTDTDTGAFASLKAITDVAGEYSPMSPFDATTTDVVLTPDFTAVRSDLGAVASQLCAGTLTVTERASSAGAPTTYRNGGAGWGVTTTVNPVGDYIKPASSAAATAATTTDSGGTALFQWAPGGTSWSKSVAFTPSGRSHYRLGSVSCTRDGTPVGVVVSAAGQVTVTGGVTGLTAVACTVRHTWTGPLTSTITLTPQKRSADSTIRLTGTLAGPLARLTGQPVKIQAKRPTGTAWKTIANRTTSSTGTFAAKVSPKRNMLYRATYAGKTTVRAHYSDVSPVRRVDVGASVYLSLSDSTVRKGATVTFSGRVAPKKAGATVLLQRRVGLTWVTVKSRKLSSRSTYVFRYTTTSTKDYRWRVFKPADSQNVANFSGAVLLQVS